MKQKTLVSVIFLLICISVFALAYNHNLRKDIIALEAEVSTSEIQITDLTNQLVVNETLIDDEYDALNSKIKAYDDLLIKWFEYDIHKTFVPKLIVEAYEVTALVHANDRSFDLPRNGYIEIDSDQVEIELSFIEPLLGLNSETNTLLHHYDDVFENMSNQFDEHYTLEGQKLTIKYDHLSRGDKVLIPITGQLKYLLKLDVDMIEINITDESKSAEDYLPKNIKSKTYYDGYNETTFTHTFDYLSDEEWIVNFMYGGYGDVVSQTPTVGDYRMGFKNRGDYYANVVTWDGKSYTSLLPNDRLMLPQVIRLGERWIDGQSTATITAVNYVLETDIGDFETIEVTYKNEAGMDEIICYYAEDLGVIKRRNHPEGELLIGVEYID